MKVLLLDQIAKVNYKYTFSLVNSLENLGIEVTLVIDQKYETENCYCKKYNIFKTSEKNISKIKKLLNYINSYRKIVSLLENENFDVLHTQWYNFSILDYYYLNKIKKKYKIKYVSTVHDILPFNEKKYDKYFHKKLYNLSDGIILQAPSNVERFSELFPESKEKISMIPLGHMLDYAEPIDMMEARKKIDIPKNKLVFLFFGQIKKVKGLDILLNAIAQIDNQEHDLYFIIAGSVWKSDFSIYEEIINKNKLNHCLKIDIRYIPDDEIKYYYSATNVCVLPYTDIYQSAVIQLAYAYKKPVIASKLSAFTQFVKEQQTGYIVEVGSIESLAETILRASLERNKFEELGQAGYQLVRQKLDWDRLTTEIYENCYK